MCGSLLQCIAVYRSVLQCIAVYCSVLQYIVASCSVLQCAAVCFSALQYVAVSCSILEYQRRTCIFSFHTGSRVALLTSVCCDVPSRLTSRYGSASPVKSEIFKKESIFFPLPSCHRTLDTTPVRHSSKKRGGSQKCTVHN